MRWLVIALALGCACKKKRAESSVAVPDDGPVPSAAPVPSLPQPAPIPAAEVGPAYASVQPLGVVRLDADGWKPVGHPGSKYTEWAKIELGVDGTLWAHDNTDVWRFDGTDFVEIGRYKQVAAIAGGPGGTLWVLADDQLLRSTGGKPAPVTLPTSDPPHALARDRDGVWVATLDRTYRGAGDTWTAFDVPGVTGAQVDITAIASTGHDAYLLTDAGVFAFDGTAWRPVRDSKVALGSYPSLVAGPAGRFAINGDKTYVGDLARGVRPLGSTSEGYILQIDARGRIWITGENEIRVLDDNFKEIKKWSGGDSAVLANRIVDLQIGAGGPVQLSAGERAAGTITGKVEGSAAGMTVRVCAQQRPEYQKDPCDGVPGAREAKTTEGGTFAITGVAVGLAYFYVLRGGRWRSTADTGCCTQLQPEGTLDVGTLALR